MLRHSLAGSLLLAAMLMGCQSQPAKSEPPPSRPITLLEFDGIRDAYHRENADIRVGLVKAVRVDLGTAAVGEVKVSEFIVGDVVSFVDSAKRTVAMGRVASISDNLLVIHFDVQPGGRPPREGDLAIRAPLQ